MGSGDGRQLAKMVVDLLSEHGAGGGVDSGDFSCRPVGRVSRGVDLELARRRAVGPQMFFTGPELHNPHRLDEPIRIDRQRPPGIAGGELVVTAVIDRGRLVSGHPDPKPLVVAAQVKLRPRHTPGSDSQSPGTFEGDIYASERDREFRAREFGVSGGKRLNPRAVAVDCRYDLIQRRRLR